MMCLIRLSRLPKNPKQYIYMIQNSQGRQKQDNSVRFIYQGEPERQTQTLFNNQADTQSQNVKRACVSGNHALIFILAFFVFVILYFKITNKADKTDRNMVDSPQQVYLNKFQAQQKLNQEVLSKIDKIQKDLRSQHDLQKKKLQIIHKLNGFLQTKSKPKIVHKQLIESKKKVESQLKQGFQLKAVEDNRKKTTLQKITQNQQNGQIEYNHQSTPVAMKSNTDKIKQFFMNVPQSSYASYTGQKSLFPKKVWFLKPKTTGFDYLEVLYLKNIKHFSKLDGFEFIEVNDDNYQNYLSPKNKARILTVLRFIRNNKSQEFGSPKYHINDILRRLKMLMILEQHGGVAISQLLSLTESLKWLQEISNNEHCNRGNPGSKTQVFGFYYDGHSSLKMKLNKYGRQEVEKYMIAFPSLQVYFLAAIKKAEYISDFIENMMEVILKPKEVKKYLKDNNIDPNYLNLKDMYDSSFPMASRLTIHKKQKQIDSLSPSGHYSRFAIDYYGINAINCYFFPFKLKQYFQNYRVETIFQSLAHLDYRQFSKQIGPLRYLTFIRPHEQIRSLLLKSTEAKKKEILKGSFLHQIFYFSENQKTIYENPEKAFAKTENLGWNSLNKVVWVYKDNNFLNNISEQLVGANIKRKAQQSGFEFVFIDDRNIKDYLDKSMISEIDACLSNSDKNLLEAKPFLVRLALLVAHGGVSITLSQVLTQNLNWLKGIPHHSSEFIFNRFGYFPKVFMLFNPSKSIVSWTINPLFNTKQQWRLAYDTNFIAAEKDNELLKEWLKEVMSYLSSSPQIMNLRLSQCRISELKQVKNENQNMIFTDALSCVISRRQMNLQQQQNKNYADATDYYKIWSMNGALSLEKLEQNTNYEKIQKYKNPFIYEYPEDYVKGIIGEWKHILKINSYNSGALSSMIIQNLGKMETVFHSKSIFFKYLYLESSKKISNVNGILVLNNDL